MPPRFRVGVTRDVVDRAVLDHPRVRSFLSR